MNRGSSVTREPDVELAIQAVCAKNGTANLDAEKNGSARLRRAPFGIFADESAVTAKMRNLLT